MAWLTAKHGYEPDAVPFHCLSGTAVTTQRVWCARCCLHHRCGFLLWPTQTKLPDGAPYGYDVGERTAGSHVDIVKQWMDLCRAAGIGPGLYYSLKDNFYLNSAAGGLVRHGPLLPGQVNVSQAEFEAIELAQLQELWSKYGTLAETWSAFNITHTTRVDLHPQPPRV
eukprot:COSAG01_NODE_3996_length_5448_cov_24.489250_5_plen_168_part_00